MALNAFRIHATGSSIVTSALMAQFLKPSKVPVTYYGISGDEPNAAKLRFKLAQTPLDLTSFRQRPGSSKEIKLNASHLGESFFQSTINLYAKIWDHPELERDFSSLLAKGKRRGAINIVSGIHRPLIQNSEFLAQEILSQIDLLICDAEELVDATSFGTNSLGTTDIPFSPNHNFISSIQIQAAIQKLFSLGLSAIIVLPEICSSENPLTHNSGIYYETLGGLFGQGRGTITFENFSGDIKVIRDPENQKDSPLIIEKFRLDYFNAGLLTDFILQILDDDFFSKGEMHLDRECLEICPLRIRHALDFAMAARLLANQGERVTLGDGEATGEGIQIENRIGERLSQLRKIFPDEAIKGRPW